MTMTLSAMMISAQNGYDGMIVNWASALRIATITPKLRPQTEPLSTPAPASTSTAPTMMCTHPQVVRLTTSTPASTSTAKSSSISVMIPWKMSNSPMVTSINPANQTQPTQPVTVVPVRDIMKLSPSRSRRRVGDVRLRSLVCERLAELGLLFRRQVGLDQLGMGADEPFRDTVHNGVPR